MFLRLRFGANPDRTQSTPRPVYSTGPAFFTQLDGPASDIRSARVEVIRDAHLRVPQRGSRLPPHPISSGSRHFPPPFFEVSVISRPLSSGAFDILRPRSSEVFDILRCFFPGAATRTPTFDAPYPPRFFAFLTPFL